MWASHNFNRPLSKLKTGCSEAVQNFKTTVRPHLGSSQKTKLQVGQRVREGCGGVVNRPVIMTQAVVYSLHSLKGRKMNVPHDGKKPLVGRDNENGRTLAVSKD